MSRRTGLAPQTASAIVTELEAEGLIARGEVLRGRRGQPATPLSLNYQAAYAIGVEIKWNHVGLVLINLGSQEFARTRRAYDYPDATTIVNEVADGIEGLLSVLTPVQRRRVAAVGLATPTGIARNIHQLGAPAAQVHAWQNFDLRAAIEARTGFATQWFNDGVAACWAEMILTPPPRPTSFAYLYVGTFIGSAIIGEPSLRQGPASSEVALGSMAVIDAQGRRRLGHHVASLSALRQRLAARGVAIPTGNPPDWPWETLEPHVSDWIAEAGAAIAEIALNTEAATSLSRIVVEADVPQEIKLRLVEQANTSVDLLPLMTFERPRIEAARLGPRATALGAAQLPLYNKLFDSGVVDVPA